MLTLLTTVILGLLFAFFATQNTAAVTVALGNYVFSGVPLYILALGSLIFGVLVSWIISLIDAVSTTLALKKREYQLKKSSESVSDLETRLRELELENAQLKVLDRRPTEVTEIHREQIVEEPGYEEPRRSIFDKLKHNLSF